MRKSRGEVGGWRGWNLQSLISPILITGNEKITYFSYLCTFIVIRQGWTPPPRKNFLDPRLDDKEYIRATFYGNHNLSQIIWMDERAGGGCTFMYILKVYF